MHSSCLAPGATPEFLHYLSEFLPFVGKIFVLVFENFVGNCSGWSLIWFWNVLCWLLLNRGRASCDTSFKVFLSPTQLDGLAFSKLSKLGIFSKKDHRSRWVAWRRENLVQNDEQVSALWQSVCYVQTTGSILINCSSSRNSVAYMSFRFHSRLKFEFPKPPKVNLFHLMLARVFSEPRNF